AGSYSRAALARVALARHADGSHAAVVGAALDRRARRRPRRAVLEDPPRDVRRRRGDEADGRGHVERREGPAAAAVGARAAAPRAQDRPRSTAAGFARARAEDGRRDRARRAERLARAARRRGACGARDAVPRAADAVQREDFGLAAIRGAIVLAR